MTDDFHDDDAPRKFTLGAWMQILRLLRPYRLHAAGLALMAILIAGSEAAMPYLTGRIVDRVAEGGGASYMPFATAYIVAFLILCACVFGFVWLAGGIAGYVCHDIRQAAFAKLQDLPFAYFDRRPVGKILSRLTSDSDRLSRILGWVVMDVVWAIVLIAGVVGAMLWQNVALALVMLVVVPPLALASLYFQRKLLVTSRAIRQANAELMAQINEGLMAVRTTKALAREEESLAEFSVAAERMHDTSLQNALLTAVYVPVVVTLASLMTGLALAYGGVKTIDGTISVGMLVSFLNYAGLFFEPVTQMARQLTEVQMAQAAAERIVALLNTEPAIRDSDEVRAAMARASQERSADVAVDGLPRRIHQIEFRQVSFAYESGQAVLHDFNLTAPSGQTIALVGPTGGGKTTIVNLLCRFYEPTAGEILLDGIDYRRRSLHWLQESLGIVQQTPRLFSGTIRENIRYGRLDATEDEILAAAQRAGAHEFIVRAGGYDANVGPAGNRLSTGQKQLVALARAILADPQIFVLDEATSSVDTETERAIQRGIEEALSGRISFVIAHRLSTIRSADRILVIEDGRIAEQGRHEQLLSQGGRYATLHSRQLLPSE